jgi:hypothetical protein
VNLGGGAVLVSGLRAEMMYRCWGLCKLGCSCWVLKLGCSSLCVQVGVFRTGRFVNLME